MALDRLEGGDGRMKAKLEVWSRREFGPSEATMGIGRGGEGRTIYALRPIRLLGGKGASSKLLLDRIRYGLRSCML